MFPLRDLPKYEAIRQRAQRYPDIDPSAVESYLILLRVAVDVLSAFDVLLSRQKMSRGRFSVLMLLNRDPDAGLSPSDLAVKAGVTRATMTGLLDGLGRENLVRREHDPADRRSVLIYLTRRARQLLDAILPDYYHRIALLMGQLSEEQKKSLVDLLMKVNAEIPALLK